MCAHYENVRDSRVTREHFKAIPTEAATRADVWPGYVGNFIVRPPEADVRDEAMAEKPSFRDAWKKARHCIIPAQAIYEPDWRSGRAHLHAPVPQTR